MYETDEIEIWNLTAGNYVRTEAQDMFNVVGRLKRPDDVATLSYVLNGGKERPIFVGESPRLTCPGAFNIDNLYCSELGQKNTLRILLVDRQEREIRYDIPFSIQPFEEVVPNFQLDLNDVTEAHQVGQVIDGHWRIGRSQEGRPCLEIRPEDAGYDRLIGFGRHDWQTGYEINARICVNSWTSRTYQNVGLIFKWNPHMSGNGESLPSQWSTGLGYYAAQCAGLRIRFGVDVHFNERGEKVGSYVLQEKPLVSWRRWAGFVRNKLIPVGRTPLAQIVPRIPYRFRLHVTPAHYKLTVWQEHLAEPAPQLSVPNPHEMLERGCVGLIACNCALSVDEYTVRPVS